MNGSAENGPRRAILEILQENSRVAPAQIAVMLGISEEEVSAEIKAMEDDRTILKYTTLVNAEKAGRDGVTALIEVKVTPERDVGFDKIAERIYRFPQVRSVFLMSGSFDLTVIVEGKTLQEVAQFVAQKLAALDRVTGTTTHFILKKYKEDGVIFEDKEEDRRLVVAP